MDYAEMALQLHKENKGKISVSSKIALETREDLSTAYTPGVAAPCLEIQKEKANAYTYTAKGNLVAVVTDGTAVLGLGDIGPEAAMPVMEGKAVLFKAFGNVDAFPICLATKDTEEIIETVKRIAPVFGGINLEDISAPRCFEIERRGHADYLTLFDNKKEEVKKFFEEKKCHQFKNIIFVSKEGKESFLKVFPELEAKTMVCNNLINDSKIKKMAEEPIELKKDEEKFTFINVGRHDEKQKKLTRIIEAAKQLKQENKAFKILLIGDGQDSKMYQELVKKEKLEDTIFFLGKKQNPYPYFKIADGVILSSDYEGYPVVFLESFILNRRILST